ncbi:hypothetical protein SAMN05444716_101521 [Streptomyces harbinensis]|uniref:Uncharacterized protein n=3 Tax=Streptomyces TaxID=1883 RepID=A0A1I6PHY3_9ACTN|nr:hypothetical protein SAMN05444716_101521 [Streptomyces harbinensis]
MDANGRPPDTGAMTTSAHRSDETVISRHLTSEGTVVWTRDADGHPRMTLYPHVPGARPVSTAGRRAGGGRGR